MPFARNTVAFFARERLVMTSLNSVEVDRIVDHLAEAADLMERGGVAPGRLLIELVAALPDDLLTTGSDYPARTGMRFDVREGRDSTELSFIADTDDLSFRLEAEGVRDVVLQANAALLALEQFTSLLRVPVSELLGLRNLSSLVSAVVVAEMGSVFGQQLFLNPHQDGYPDLLPKVPECLNYLDKALSNGQLSEKALWTDPGFGGVEVKATCGNTPPARQVPKPGLGETRSPIIVGYDWKAHHRETKRLLGTVWDFVDGVPTVTAAFYRNDLTEADWGSIVAPKAGGGRTTSVSIMNRAGLNSMASGWVVRCSNDPMRAALAQGGLGAGTGR